MTNKEFEKYEERFESRDKALFETIQKYFHHPAVCHCMKSISLRQKVFPIIFSDKTDKEIFAELDKIAPPGRTYF